MVISSTMDIWGLLGTQVVLSENENGSFEVSYKDCGNEPSKTFESLTEAIDVYIALVKMFILKVPMGERLALLK